MQKMIWQKAAKRRHSAGDWEWKVDVNLIPK